MWPSVLCPSLFFLICCPFRPLFGFNHHLCSLIPEPCLWTPPSMWGSPTNPPPASRAPLACPFLDSQCLQLDSPSETNPLLIWAPSSPYPARCSAHPGTAWPPSPSMLPLHKHPGTARDIGVHKCKKILYADTIFQAYQFTFLHIPVWLRVDMSERKIMSAENPEECVPEIQYLITCGTINSLRTRNYIMLLCSWWQPQEIC